MEEWVVVMEKVMEDLKVVTVEVVYWEEEEGMTAMVVEEADSVDLVYSQQMYIHRCT
jgi:hypothetical protein